MILWWEQHEWERFKSNWKQTEGFQQNIDSASSTDTGHWSGSSGEEGSKFTLQATDGLLLQLSDRRRPRQLGQIFHIYAGEERENDANSEREKMVRNRDNWEKRDNPPMSVFMHCLSGRKCNVRADSTSNYHLNPINLITNTYIHTQTGAIAMY